MQNVFYKYKKIGKHEILNRGAQNKFIKAKIENKTVQNKNLQKPKSLQNLKIELFRTYKRKLRKTNRKGKSKNEKSKNGKRKIY